MKGGVYKNKYYMGVRPGLGVRTRDDTSHGLQSIDRDRKPHTRENSWAIDAMRGHDVDDSLWRESERARCDIDINWSPDNRANKAFGDHNDYRADWGNGR